MSTDPLIGLTQVAKILGLSVQRTNTVIQSDPAFPAPVPAPFLTSRVWRETDIRLYAKNRVDRRTLQRIDATRAGAVLAGMDELRRQVAAEEEAGHAGDDAYTQGHLAGLRAAAEILGIDLTPRA